MTRVRRALRSVATVTSAALARVRGAIYTRKSTDEGLDRDFNSLDNQRERGEACIASQGWELIATRYDDGGCSGGNADRPALKQLLRDVEAGEINAIVVYRLDRLSRSLADFVAIHRFLEKHNVALISVTESINTSTPHGRMMVNVLLSFAQYERELAAERTRHKISAARRRGKWTGGRPLLGYDAVDGRLVVNKDESAQVKAIFEMYVATPSLVGVTQTLNNRGWRNKSWVAKTGRQCGGGEWSKASLRRLLTDPLYIGKQKLKGETFPGEHKAILPKALFDKVQRVLDENRSNGGASARNAHGFLLRGLVRCAACDSSMVPSPAKRRGKVYRYYRCSSSEKNGAASCPTKSVQADQIERHVVDQIKRIGADPQLQDETFRQAISQIKAQRRGLKAEKKRLERDLVTLRTDVERLVGAVSRITGQAAVAIAAELEKAQQRLTTLENRQREIQVELADLNVQAIDGEHLAQALEEFTPIWDVLLTPERERVLKLLIARISYDGRTQKLTIDWRLAGFGKLANEVRGG